MTAHRLFALTMLLDAIALAAGPVEPPTVAHVTWAPSPRLALSEPPPRAAIVVQADDSSTLVTIRLPW